MIPIYLDNCGNSRANTWLPAPTLVERALLLVQNQSSVLARAPASPLVTLDNFVLIAWPLCWRRIFQMSALSNVDGT